MNSVCFAETGQLRLFKTECVTYGSRKDSKLVFSFGLNIFLMNNNYTAATNSLLSWDSPSLFLPFQLPRDWCRGRSARHITNLACNRERKFGPTHTWQNRARAFHLHEDLDVCHHRMYSTTRTHAYWDLRNPQFCDCRGNRTYWPGVDKGGWLAWTTRLQRLNRMLGSLHVRRRLRLCWKSDARPSIFNF